MKEDFSNNELENRLRKAAEQFALPPSDKVWEGINSQLHPRKKRRPWLWVAAALLALSLGTYFIQDQTGENVNNNASVTVSPEVSDKIPPEVQPGKSGNESDDLRAQTPVPAKSNPSKGRVKWESIHQRKVDSGYNKKPVTIVSASSENTGVEDKILVPNCQLPFLSSGKMSLRFPEVTHIEMAEMPVSLLQVRTEISPIIPADVNSSTIANKATTQGKDKNKHINYQVFFTSGFGYRTFDINSAYHGRDQMSAPVNQQTGNRLSPLAIVYRKEGMKQYPDWSYSAGLRIVLPLGHHYSLQTGLTLTQVGYRVRAYGTYPAYVRTDGSSTVSNYNDANSVYTQNGLAASVEKPGYIHNHYLFGEIPVLVSREFGSSDKLHFQVGFGAGLLYMIRSSPVIYSPESGRYFRDKSLLRPLNGNFHLEADMIVPLSKKLNFTIGPSLQYQILSSYKDYQNVAEHPYFPGIKAGLQWKK